MARVSGRVNEAEAGRYHPGGGCCMNGFQRSANACSSTKLASTALIRSGWMEMTSETSGDPARRDSCNSLGAGVIAWAVVRAG